MYSTKHRRGRRREQCGSFLAFEINEILLEALAKKTDPHVLFLMATTTSVPLAGLSCCSCSRTGRTGGGIGAQVGGEAQRLPSHDGLADLAEGFNCTLLPSGFADCSMTLSALQAPGLAFLFPMSSASINLLGDHLFSDSG